MNWGRTRRTSPADLARLVRAPAALTVPGDVLAGAVAAGSLGPRTLGGMASSVCLYWAGMALNDYADRHLDAVERPERPIPSGAVSARTALLAAGGLTIAGLCLSAATRGRDGLARAVPLAGAVWAYDLALKSTPAGPLCMAVARGLNVLSGAPAGRGRAALPAVLAVGAHTAATTRLSRYEVTGAPARLPRDATRTTVAIVLGTSAAGITARRGRSAAVLATALAAGYLAVCRRAQRAATADPSARNVRNAVAVAIHGLIPLQAALAAASGAPLPALSVAALFPVSRRLGRTVEPT